VKLVYLGTPGMAVPPLQAIVEAGHEVVLVVTRPDTRRGRGATVSPSPVKAVALELGLPVTHEVDEVIGAGADLGVVVAFGQIIRPHVLRALPMVNLHFSLLPRWRGAAPVERALLAGDQVTGVCVMAVEEGLDTGGVYAREEVAIGPETTAAELRTDLVSVGTGLLLETLARPVADWIGRADPQQGEVTHAAKLSASDLQIDWTEPPERIHRLIRVGGAWTTFRGKRLKVNAARLVDGALRLDIVQPEGRSPMPFEAWSNGARPRPGELPAGPAGDRFGAP
jgi:methionyl-tRNA formyltransferase